MVGQTVLADTGVFMDRDRDAINAALAAAYPPLPTTVTGDFTIPPTVSGTYVFTKGSAAAITLGAPGQDGLILVLIAGSAQLHVLTATNLLQTGSAAVSVLTFVAAIGASVTLLSRSGKWMVLSNNHVTETS